MNLAGINQGDIVRLIDGSYGEVVKRERGRLLVCWLRSTSTRWVKAREVEAGWRRVRRKAVAVS